MADHPQLGDIYDALRTPAVLINHLNSQAVLPHTWHGFDVADGRCSSHGGKYDCGSVFPVMSGSCCQVVCVLCVVPVGVAIRLC